MPIYEISDPKTGKRIQIAAPRQPTEREIHYIWAHPKRELPASLKEPIKVSTDPATMEAAAAPLMAPPGTLNEPRRALTPPPTATPLSLFTGVTTAPASAAMGALADDPGNALGALKAGAETAFRAPITPSEEQPTPGGELIKRGVPLSGAGKLLTDIMADPTNMIGGDVVSDVAKAGIIAGPAAAKGIGRFYSRLTTEVLPRFKANAMHPSRLLSDIKNFAAPSEAEWTGVLDWLTKKGNTPVTRAEFEEFVSKNPLKIEEKRYGFEDAQEYSRASEAHARAGVRENETGRALRELQSMHPSDGVPLAIELASGRRTEDQARALMTERFNERVQRYIDSDRGSYSPDEIAEIVEGDLQKIKAFADAHARLNEAKAEVGRITEKLGGQPVLPRWGRSDLNLPGGEDYREIVLTLPVSAKTIESGWTTRQNDDGLWEIDRPDGSLADIANTEEEARTAINHFAVGDPIGVGDVRSGYFAHEAHWPGVKNPMAHLRLKNRQTADGTKALFMEELQSDWNRAARDKVEEALKAIARRNNLPEDTKPSEILKYARDEERAIIEAEGFARQPSRETTAKYEQAFEEARVRAIESNRRFAGVRAAMIGVLENEPHARGYFVSMTPPRFISEARTMLATMDANGRRLSAQARESLTEAIRAAEEAIETATKATSAERALSQARTPRGVPDMPYKGDDWLELGMKRALIEAVESGADELSWTTGAQQSERYDGLLRDITGIRRPLHSSADGHTLEAKIQGQWHALEPDQVKEIQRLMSKEDRAKFDAWKSEVDQVDEFEGKIARAREAQRGMVDMIRDRLMTKYGVPNAHLGGTDSIMRRAKEMVTEGGLGASDDVLQDYLQRHKAFDSERRSLIDARHKARTTEVTHHGYVLINPAGEAIAAGDAKAMERWQNDIATIPAYREYTIKPQSRKQRVPKEVDGTFTFSSPLTVGSAAKRMQYDEKMVSIANKLAKRHGGGAQVKKSKVLVGNDEESIVGGGSFGNEVDPHYYIEKKKAEGVDTTGWVIRKTPTGRYDIIAKRPKYEEVWSLPITPQMRGQVTDKGLPLAAAAPLGLMREGEQNEKPQGQIEPGNIDLHAQPVVKNEDGTTSTVHSFSVNFDGKEYLLPTVMPDGRKLSEADAIKEFQRTGKHLGVFRDEPSATAYAQRLHEDYEAGKFEKAETQYERWLQKHKVTDADDPNKSFYDYRAAFRAGAEPDKTGHWPSAYKLPGHPSEVVGGFNTRTGRREPHLPRATAAELEAMGWDRETAQKLAAMPEPHQPAKYSSTQINLPPDVSRVIRSMAEAIPYDDLAADGREDTPHVTVKYGLTTTDAGKVRRLLAKQPPITVSFGKTSLFRNEDADVVKVDADGEELRALNKKIADALDHEDTHPDYKPHATVAYVKPGRGKKYVGKGALDGHSIVVDRIVFSGKDGQRVVIPLTGKPAN